MSVEVNRNTSYDDCPQLMTVPQVAALTGLSTWCIYKGIHEGTIPAHRIGRKVLLIPKEHFHPSRAKQQVTP